MIAGVYALLVAVAAIAGLVAVCGMMNDRNNRYPGWLLLVAMVAGLLAWAVMPAKAHDHEHPELDQWYATRKQPDSGISCCGPSDAYWCNEGARGSQVICTIDDDRDDKKLGRPDIPNGTVVEIPQHKINKDPNPTGRAVVWLSPNGFVWCFVGASSF